MVERPVALITGGAKRVGRGICEHLAARGFNVVVHANTSVRDAEILCEELRDTTDASAFSAAADLTNWNATASLVYQAMTLAGRVDLLVNNASIFEDDSVTDLDEPGWDRHFAVHLKAPALLAQEFSKALPGDRAGLIVNMIDERVWALNPRFFSYTLSKSALWTATRTMAQALAPRIRVNAIGPGPTLPNERQDRSAFDEQVAAVPLKRGPELCEIGEAVYFFWKAKSVTGQMLALDGGQHLAWQTPDATGQE
ncbi:MAG: SDR family oxidoreductase [Pseudomonadota bacterium]